MILQNCSLIQTDHYIIMGKTKDIYYYCVQARLGLIHSSEWKPTSEIKIL